MNVPTNIGTMATEERRVDKEGRVTLPKELRDALGIDPGSRVRIERSDGEIVLTPRVFREALTETMIGCITAETATSEPIDSLDLKKMWMSDLDG